MRQLALHGSGGLTYSVTNGMLRSAKHDGTGKTETAMDADGSSRADVYIVGTGAVTPFGRGVDALWEGLLSGRSALKPAEVIPQEGLRSPLVGEVDGYPEQHRLPRGVRMLLDAAEEALRPISDDIRALRQTGIALGTNFGGMSRAETGLFERPKDLDGYEFGYGVRLLREQFGLGGPAVILSLSCASGTAALWDAMQMLREGVCSSVLVAGFDELSRYALVGLSALRAVTSDTIKPFAEDRSGTIFSEGAGALLLSHRPPERRAVRILSVVLNNDAYHLTAPEKTGKQIGSLIRRALDEAGLSPDNIDYINAHATGTPYNDANESRVFSGVFGARIKDIPVSATKGAIGHLMGAAGAVETIAAVKAALEGVIPPTVNSEPPDAEIVLDVVRGGPRPCRIRSFLKCSYGIGGTNACAVFSVAGKD